MVCRSREREWPCGTISDVSSGLARTALSNRIWTGMGRGRLGWLIGELASPWAAAEEDRLLARREHERLRAAGAGPDHDLPFTDRVIVTLVHLRFQLPHAALAELYRVHRSTVTRAIGEVRPLLAARGFAVPGEPGIRLRTLADVFRIGVSGASTCCICRQPGVRHLPGRAMRNSRARSTRHGRNAARARALVPHPGKAGSSQPPGTLHGNRRAGLADQQPEVIRAWRVQPGIRASMPGG